MSPHVSYFDTDAEIRSVKNICCIGAGYVGGPTCAVLAWKCPDIKVTITDIAEDRIRAWNSDELPIFEPGLDDIVKEARGRNLFFTTDVDGSIEAADLIFVSVNTPTKVAGIGAGLAADLCYIEAATRRIATVSKRGAIIVEKSTVPCRTAESMNQILSALSPSNATFEILSNPEFLAEGTAVEDLLDPARVLIGSMPTTRGRLAQQRLAEVYSRWVRPEAIVTMGLWSSELSKLAANALLAQRVSSINAIAAICERTEANVHEVSSACRLDLRIGSKFLEAGIGFGGSCFQKDLQNLVYLSLSLGLPEVAEYWKQVLVMNAWTKQRFARNIVQKMFSTITAKHIAILGFAFKADTGDTREAPAIDVCRDLLEDGALLHIYDPKVSSSAINRALGPAKGSNVSFQSEQRAYTVEASMQQACVGASALVFLTKWAEFESHAVDWKAIYASMSKPAWIFDGRNIVKDPTALKKLGFIVYQSGVGY
ncbi:nucleotide sugar dehydrogenase [Microstroma glucosiphilum]|uniref:UDP-glucose 6-dehydrogenase n=1 Tax=Pseudomicrostroma glucosiphilum TaxID=1684307 RepID=A0A316U0W1_9BASI|nr:nucleotide sugar dehydrogenase [Pseudomicrostroma glucosiphilum]PWN18840.1 nucleotide sugar dehydrogenase [Pseudomicrostroma glucosiphilum]